MPRNARQQLPWAPEPAIDAVLSRLRAPLGWFPYPLLLASGLVLLLTAHVTTATNPRMGNPADIITFPSQPRRDSAVWLSISPAGEQILVTTNDRRVFRWPQQVRGPSETAELVRYLKARVAKEIETAALLSRPLGLQGTVVIAADQRLKYLHVRPLIQALAAAGITQYAFETQNPLVATSNGNGKSHATEEAQRPE